MSKQIYVQAQADHIASLFKGSPLSAVEELIWNALDADAHEVKVDLIANEFGAIQAVRVSDDGTGIDILKADATFGSLGGSWKRNIDTTTSEHRRLHGRHGCGRFRAFVLGCYAEWRTTVREGGELVSYKLSGDSAKPGVFELDAMDQGPATGTEVFISEIRSASAALTQTSEVVQGLAAKFALYLKSYPDVRIYFNGLPVTPVIMQQQTTDYELTIANGAKAKLEVIEWKRKFAGAGRLVFAGPDGFQLHEQTVGVRSGAGIPYTAYLVAPRFPALAAENALVMDELHPEVRMYLDETRRVLKAHFAARENEKSPFEIEWEEKLSALSADEKKVLYLMLKKSLKAR